MTSPSSPSPRRTTSRYINQSIAHEMLGAWRIHQNIQKLARDYGYSRRACTELIARSQELGTPTRPRYKAGGRRTILTEPQRAILEKIVRDNRYV